MTELTVTMHPELALHARPAAQFVKLAKQFDALITVEKEGSVAKANSIISLIGIDAGKGSTVTIKADGSDESAAVEALAKFLQEGS
ncbi:MAG: HPr family phosphocarrier protein [Armatimonadota bacterium]